MDTEQRPQSSAKPAYRTERIIASLVMAWVIILTSYMIFQERALSQESIYFLKILLALSGAVMLATLPGFFDINYGVGGLSIRAAGGAAAFVFIYTQSPSIPNFSKPTAAPYSAPAAPRQGTTSSNLHFDSDATPMLVALSIDPFGMASAMSSFTAGSEAGGTNSGGTTILVSNDGTLPSYESTMVSTAVTVIRTSLTDLASGALKVLNRVAEALRTAVSWMGLKASSLIDQLRLLNGAPVSELQAFVASLPDTAGDLLNSAVTPAFTAVNQLGTTLGESLPVVASLGETVRDVPGILTSTVGNTVDTVGDLVTGVLRSPGDTLALTGKAVHDLTENLAGTTKDVLETTRGLTNGVNAQVAAITEKLNDVAPSLIAPISPVLGKLDATTNTLHDVAGDVTSALPPLTAALGEGNGLQLPQLPLPTGGLLKGRVEEVRGGCSNCLLQPLDLGGRRDLTASAGLGGALSGLGIGRAGGGGGVSSGGGIASSGGGISSGAAGGIGGGAGPVSSTLRGVGGAVGNTVGGLLRRR